MTQPPRTWTLLGADGIPYESAAPGAWGGNAKDRIYGRLDCGSALSALRRGGYAEHRVFFADAGTARAAGFRPCGNCLRTEYAEWRATRALSPGSQPRGIHEAGKLWPDCNDAVARRVSTGAPQ